jgi:rubrerythrin
MGNRNMSDQSENRDIVSSLAEHEQAIGRLYRTYASRFPQHRDFWSRLADEEDQHAMWLRRLLVRVEEGLGCVRADRFDRSAVADSLRRVGQMVEEAAKPEFSSADALRTALAVEETLLEAEYFEVFEGTAAEVVQVQYCLADATRDHSRRIRAMMSFPEARSDE